MNGPLNRLVTLESLNSELTNIIDSVSGEETRAQGAENSLNTTISAEQNRAEAAEAAITTRAAKIPFVTDKGALGDGITNNDNALAQCIAAGGVWYVPAGTYILTSNAALLTPGSFTGPGVFSLNGWLFPAGDVNTFVNLNVPSIFPTIQKAVDWCDNRVFKGASGFASINIADGTYNITQIEPLFPQGADRIQIVGNTGTPANVILNFDATNNQCGFLFQRGSGCYLIDGVTINGVNGWASHGVWNTQCYGAGVMAQYNSHVQIGSSVRINKFYYGVSSRYSSSIYCHAGVIVQEAGDVGYHAFGSASVNAQTCQVFLCADTGTGLGFGFCAESGGFIDCSYSTAANCGVAGFYTNNGGAMWAHSTNSSGNGSYGYYAINGGRMEINTSPGAVASNAYNNGASGVYALNGGYINANSAQSNNNGAGFTCTNGAFMDITAASASHNKGAGYTAYLHGGMSGDNANAYSNGTDGFQTNTLATITAKNAIANGNGGYGFNAFNLSFMTCLGGTGSNNTSGLRNISTNDTAGSDGAYLSL